MSLMILEVGDPLVLAGVVLASMLPFPQQQLLLVLDLST
jgi:hypothetical protein